MFLIFRKLLFSGGGNLSPVHCRATDSRFADFRSLGNFCRYILTDQSGQLYDPTHIQENSGKQARRTGRVRHGGLYPSGLQANTDGRCGPGAGSSQGDSLSLRRKQRGATILTICACLRPAFCSSFTSAWSSTPRLSIIFETPTSRSSF